MYIFFIFISLYWCFKRLQQTGVSIQKTRDEPGLEHDCTAIPFGIPKHCPSRYVPLKKFMNQQFSPIVLYPSSTKVSAIPTYVLHALHVYFILDIFSTYMLLDKNCTFIREIRVCNLGNGHFNLFNSQNLTFGHLS